ncbi:MAG TPA: LUD domain-containing protein [Solirubrobacteraceae bacterium]|nr:LUD domain-containing protein [Solirubrobacteraceae bacterium]
MSEAREVILGRIRGALADVPSGERPEDVPVARDYARQGELSGAELIERFAERVRDYNAEVRRVAAGEVAGAVAVACADWGLSRVAVPAGWPEQWRPADVELIEDAGLTAHELDDINAAVTGCAVAIAETGTLVLDGQGVSGRRLLTLVPDHHICIVTVDQIAGTVPEAVAELAPAVREQRAPITLVSGPSASSDIELSRVEGVHGPRHLRVLIAGDA